MKDFEKCDVCGSEKFIVDTSFGGADSVCGSCGTYVKDQTKQKPKNVKPPEPLKLLVKRNEFSSEQLLKQWLNEGNLEALVLIGIPKDGGGWKYGTSDSSFEFLAGAEGVMQKLKLGALNFTPVKVGK